MYPLLEINVNHFNVFSAVYLLIQIKCAPFQFSNDGPTQVLNFKDQYFEIKNNHFKDIYVNRHKNWVHVYKKNAHLTRVLQMLCQMNHPKCFFGPYWMRRFRFLIEKADTNNTMFVISLTSTTRYTRVMSYRTCIN